MNFQVLSRNKCIIFCMSTSNITRQLISFCNKRMEVKFKHPSRALWVLGNDWVFSTDHKRFYYLFLSIEMCVQTTLLVTEHEFVANKSSTHLGALPQVGYRFHLSTGWQCHTQKSDGALIVGRNAASLLHPPESGKRKRRTRALSVWRRTVLGWEPVKWKIIYLG